MTKFLIKRIIIVKYVMNLSKPRAITNILNQVFTKSSIDANIKN